MAAGGVRNRTNFASMNRSFIKYTKESFRCGQYTCYVEDESETHRCCGYPEQFCCREILWNSWYFYLALFIAIATFICCCRLLKSSTTRNSSHYSRLEDDVSSDSLPLYEEAQAVSRSTKPPSYNSLSSLEPQTPPPPYSV